MGNYERIGGLEVARVGDDARMEEIKRKVASAKAFGTRAHLIEPAEIKEKFPLIEESMVQGGLWDPDAGLVIAALADGCRQAGRHGRKDRQVEGLRQYARQVADHRGGRIKGVESSIAGRSWRIHVVVCAGIWGRLIAEMAARTCRSCRSTIR
jgi:glycine/D-amino acid oxidase-like deaminating enzyme